MVPDSHRIQFGVASDPQSDKSTILELVLFFVSVVDFSLNGAGFDLVVRSVSENFWKGRDSTRGK
jgi:hypothetical protein